MNEPEFVFERNIGQNTSGKILIERTLNGGRYMYRAAIRLFQENQETKFIFSDVQSVTYETGGREDLRETMKHNIAEDPTPLHDAAHSAKLLRLADALADVIIHDITDKHGQPLILHCRRVAEACSGLTIEQRIAAILHDCIEDSPSKRVEEIIDTVFGTRVYCLVLYLSRIAGEEYCGYIRLLAEEEPDAIPIKLADLEDNLDASRGDIPESLRERYIEAKQYLEECLEQHPKQE